MILKYNTTYSRGIESIRMLYKISMNFIALRTKINPYKQRISMVGAILIQSEVIVDVEEV